MRRRGRRFDASAFLLVFTIGFRRRFIIVGVTVNIFAYIPNSMKIHSYEDKQLSFRICATRISSMKPFAMANGRGHDVRFPSDLLDN